MKKLVIDKKFLKKHGACSRWSEYAAKALPITLTDDQERNTDELIRVTNVLSNVTYQCPWTLWTTDAFPEGVLSRLHTPAGWLHEVLLEEYYDNDPNDGDLGYLAGFLADLVGIYHARKL